jgi:mRNA interferase MazF
MVKFPEQSSIYWFDPEPVKGSELRKVRPCIVVSPNEMNRKLSTILVVPLASTIRPWPFRVSISVLGQKASAACDQLRVINKTRLRAHIGNLKKQTMNNCLACFNQYYLNRFTEYMLGRWVHEVADKIGYKFFLD